MVGPWNPDSSIFFELDPAARIEARHKLFTVR